MAAAKKNTAAEAVAEHGAIGAAGRIDDAPEVEHVIEEPIIDEAFTEAVATGWEYAHIKGFDPDVLLSHMNGAGQDGWEAVSVDPYHGIAWLKRQIAVTPPVEEAATDTIVADDGSES